VNLLDKISYESGSFYIFDRGYLDFERLHTIHHSKSFFVIRARNNLKFKRLYSSAVDKTKGIKCDQIGQLKWFYSIKSYPDKIRRIKFYDKDQQRTFVFLTNHTELKAEEIADLYKNRWKIELFFKWIKQHLRITAFWGRTENAVRPRYTQP
ncbi:MAG: IS4 family transposase, partial [Flavitalea sp.]